VTRAAPALIVIAVCGLAASAIGAAPRPSPAGLRVALMGIGVEVHPGYVRVSEVINLENTTRETFTGDLPIGVPAAARYITFHQGLVRPRVDGEWLIDRLTVPPGPYRLAIAYSIGGSGDLDLGRPVAVPIDRLVVLATGAARIRSAQIETLPSVVDDGRTVARAAGRAIAPGTLVLRVEGVPFRRQWPAPAAAGLLGAILALALVRASLAPAALGREELPERR
jgi:hypothetical protein